MARTTPNYIPRPDADFNSWALNFWANVDSWTGVQPMPPAQVATLEDAIAIWAATYPALVKARAAAESATAAKAAAREVLESAIRPLAASIQALPTIRDADRLQAGLTVRDRARSPHPAPSTRPLVSVDTPARLTHTLRLSDESTPSRKAKPRGSRGAEVWMTLVDAGTEPPRDPELLRFLSLTTRPTVRAEYKAQDGGKTAVYMLRWVGRNGEKGPWSEVASATVAA